MFHAFHALAASAAIERVTLLVNHVLAAELAATQRLRRHFGQRITLKVSGWPGSLPALPGLSWCVTPAGLLERCGEAGAEEPALRINIDASNPAQLALRALAGERPRVDVAGDAAFAADVNWLFDNLRWDIENDLEGSVGPVAARQLGEIGASIARAVRSVAQTLAGTGDRAAERSV